ncbi:AAA family ATPase [Bradyrhizobium sp. 172]|uniref:AAA family ATPase n=1 Tax=Bradyrhizobium sp. 172 TaxID=2782643 RepID=UPI001FFF26CE|nr:AAA family ATPase [Bradyrhizobium sp. 172]UPJ97392.1 AAA family ATPase [Bradyrhizobium sp. 172]
MRIKGFRSNNFRRFTDLEIENIPKTARLVVLAGPNGCGKSSVFDAMNLFYQMNVKNSWMDDKKYYWKLMDDPLSRELKDCVAVYFHDIASAWRPGILYFRSAYRNDPEFSFDSLERVGPAVDEIRFRRMIEGDAAVAMNYRRLTSDAFQNVFEHAKPETNIGEFRESVVGEIRDSVNRIFPDLVLRSLGNPLSGGTFRFDKGTVSGFDYKNLSGGEKAAFDLLLDIIVKRPAFPDAIYCIDEPEAHMNSRLQGALLQELLNLVPESGQLWISTHSIGMMRKAREIYELAPGTVAFLDFDGHDFDSKVVISPSRPTRIFWEKVLRVALDDLAGLVAPQEIVVCEGNPIGAVPGKNAEHDARCYETIFADEKPDVKFIAGGNSHDVKSDRMGFLAAFPMIVAGIKVRRLIDGDDHAPGEAAQMVTEGIRVLGRRHLESYLYDDEILTALCQSVGKAAEVPLLLAEKKNALSVVQAQGKAPDDVKSAAGLIYTRAKQILGLTKIGNDQKAFARNVLCPLITPDTATYAGLKRDIFGV